MIKGNITIGEIALSFSNIKIETSEPDGNSITSEKEIREFITDTLARLGIIETAIDVIDESLKKSKPQFKEHPEKEKTENTKSHSKHHSTNIDKVIFDADYYNAIADPDKRLKAIYQKRFNLRHNGKLTTAIDELTNSMCELAKSQKKSQNQK